MKLKTKQYTRNARLAGFSAIAFLAFAMSAQADLVTNGSFESTRTAPDS